MPCSWERLSSSRNCFSSGALKAGYWGLLKTSLDLYRSRSRRRSEKASFWRSRFESLSQVRSGDLKRRLSCSPTSLEFLFLISNCCQLYWSHLGTASLFHAPLLCTIDRPFPLLFMWCLLLSHSLDNWWFSFLGERPDWPLTVQQ